jgi:TonB family protein
MIIKTKVSVRIMVFHCTLFLCLAAQAQSATADSSGPVYRRSVDSLRDSTTSAVNHSAHSDSLKNDTLSPVDIMPELKQFVRAEYPAEIVKLGIEGVVLLDIVINDSGTVDSVYVIKGKHPVLDSSAAAAARAFVFTPAMAGGKPVAVLLQYAYRFTIDEVETNIEQFVNLQGKLLERGTKEPLINAMVMVSFPDTINDTGIAVPFHTYLKKIGSFVGQSLQAGSLITATDSLGSFQFKSLPACSIVVKVLAPDFESFTDRLLILHGKAIEAVYHLKRISYGDNEIVVYGKTEKREVAQRTLTLNEVRRIPGLGGDAVKVIMALPGVARSAFNLGTPVIRGAGGGSSRFFLDGVKLPNLFHFGGLTSTYNSTALESVDLYPGGFGTRYGGALGGIVEIKGRKPKTDRIHGYLDGNLLDASFLVEGPISKKVSFLVAARRSYIANVMSFVLDKAGAELPFTVVPYYWDYLARADFDLVKSNHFYLTLFGAKDAMDLVSNDVRGGSARIDAETNRAKMSQYFHMGIFGWDWALSDKLKNELRYSIEYDNVGVSVFGAMSIKGDGLEHYLRDQLTCTASDVVKMNAGLDFDMYPYDLNLTLTSGQGVIVPDASHYFFGPIGVYANLEWKPVKRLLLIPGIRYDYYPELIYDGSVVPEFWNYRSFNNNRGISGEPSVRLTSKYEIFPGQRIKGSLGTYNQTPQPLGQAIDTAWGNPYLPAEKGSQYVAGYEWQISDLISLDAQIYYNRQWDNARQASSKDIAAKRTEKYFGDGKSRMKGFELLLKHDQGKRFFGWLSYSLSRSERSVYESYRWAIFEEDQTNYLQLIGSYRITPSNELGVRLRYVTGNPTTPISGVDYFDATSRRYVPKRGELNSDRMGPYLSFDVRYEKKVVYKTWLWSIYLDVTHAENLFNKGYRSPEFSNYQWNYDYSNKEVFSDITRPALGLRVEF